MRQSAQIKQLIMSILTAEIFIASLHVVASYLYFTEKLVYLFTQFIHLP